MTVEGSDQVQPVPVLISYEALAQLDPTNVRDVAAASEHFDKFRTRVETAASEKFDRGGIESEKWEDMPLIPSPRTTRYRLRPGRITHLGFRFQNWDLV
jgi:Protein of unknown function (DUF1488)